MARDADLPLSMRFSKGLRYASALATAPVHLAACDVVGRRARTHLAPLIENLGRIELGDDVQLNSRYAPIRLSTGRRGVLRIGDGTNVNFGVRISAELNVSIGSRVDFGPHVSISDHDEGSAPGSAPEPVEIGDDVWLAAGVRVRKGSVIGQGTVVVAGSVVEGRLPPRVVAGGIPARVLRRLDPAPEAPVAATPAPEGATRTPDARGILIADFSIQELEGLLAQEDTSGLVVEAKAAPFGQVVQSLHALGTADAGDFALVWTRPEATVPAFASRLEGETASLDQMLAEVDAFADLLRQAASKVRTLLVASWTLPPFHRGLGMLDLRKDGVASALMRMNLRLVERLEDMPQVHVLDAQRWIAAAGEKAVSSKLWYLAKVGFAREVLSAAAADVRAALSGVRGRAKKLVVLDLDDTLWGGIVGDQGWQNLRLGGHDALGESFVDFQRHLKGLARRGIALAVVSKNEESVALDAIRSHPEMVLKVEDFAAWRINWRDKAMNIVEIVKELNLGLQSVVFIDDNPIERARVREALPEVFVPEWPEDKTQYVRALLQLRCFDVPSISAEDLARTEQYRTERARDEMKAQFASLDEWLAGLGIKVRFSPIDAANVARTTQLLNKTNQMNLRTRRLTEPELTDWARSEGHELWAINVSDKLGDAGLTGVLGLEFRGDTATVTDYVLSCRVMGRKVEETLVWAALERARARGVRRFEAPYVPTAKNKPCLDFWRSSGLPFDEATSTFRWSLDETYQRPGFITVEGLPGTGSEEVARG